MNIRYGNGTTKYGPGVSIDLDGKEVALAIHAYLVAHGVNVSGPRTVTVNGELCECGEVYVDPSGKVISWEAINNSWDEETMTTETTSQASSAWALSTATSL